MSETLKERILAIPCAPPYGSSIKYRDGFHAALQSAAAMGEASFEIEIESIPFAPLILRCSCPWIRNYLIMEPLKDGDSWSIHHMEDKPVLVGSLEEAKAKCVEHLRGLIVPVVKAVSSDRIATLEAELATVKADRDALNVLAYETRPGLDVPAITWAEHSQYVCSSLYAVQDKLRTAESQLTAANAELEAARKSIACYEQNLGDIVTYGTTADVLDKHLQEWVARAKATEEKLNGLQASWKQLAGFATCNSGSDGYSVSIKYKTLEQAQAAYSAMADMGKILNQKSA